MRSCRRTVLSIPVPLCLLAFLSSERTCRISPTLCICPFHLDRHICAVCFGLARRRQQRVEPRTLGSIPTCSAEPLTPFSQNSDPIPTPLFRSIPAQLTFAIEVFGHEPPANVAHRFLPVLFQQLPCQRKPATSLTTQRLTAPVLGVDGPGRLQLSIRRLVAKNNSSDR